MSFNRGPRNRADELGVLVDPDCASIANPVGCASTAEYVWTHRDIAWVLGMSHQRVDQLERRAIRKLWRQSPAVRGRRVR